MKRLRKRIIQSILYSFCKMHAWAFRNWVVEFENLAKSYGTLQDEDIFSTTELSYWQF